MRRLFSVVLRRMCARKGHLAEIVLAVLAVLPGGVVCPQPGAVMSAASTFTGFWEVVLEDSSMLAMIYSEPTTLSSPLALVPSGSVLRGVEDWYASHSPTCWLFVRMKLR